MGDGFVQRIPQPLDAEVATSVKRTTKSVGSTLQGVSVMNFITTIVMGASMQQLFGMIRTLHVIIWTGLIEINLPGKVLVFMQGAI